MVLPRSTTIHSTGEGKSSAAVTCSSRPLFPQQPPPPSLRGKTVFSHAICFSLDLRLVASRPTQGLTERKRNRRCAGGEIPAARPILYRGPIQPDAGRMDGHAARRGVQYMVDKTSAAEWGKTRVNIFWAKALLCAAESLPSRTYALSRCQLSTKAREQRTKTKITNEMHNAFISLRAHLTT